MWEDSCYFWVVLCKNHWFHARKNLLFRHKILLAETDAVTSGPPIDYSFKVRCDECGKEYAYKPSEVLRVEHDPPESFTPHPLFRNEDTGPHPDAVDRSPDDTRHRRLLNLAQIIVWRTVARSRSLFGKRVAR